MIDIELVKYLTREQAERMRAFEQLFSSPGWDMLQELVQAQYDAAKLAVLASQSWPDNRIQTGRMQILGELLNMEEAIGMQLESHAAEMKQQKELSDMDAELEYE